MAQPVRRGGGRPVAIRVAIVLLALGAGALVLGAIATAQVLESGSLVDYTKARIDRVEVFGGVELLIEREAPTKLDALNALVLAALSGVAALAWWRLPRPRPRRLVRFLGLLAIGAGFLSLDEVLALHETIGHNLGFLQDVTGAHSPDDVVIVLYSLPALAFLGAFRDVVLASRVASVLVAGGLAAYAAAAALDVADAIVDEQLVEVTSSLLLLAGFGATALHYVDPRRPADFLAGRERSEHAGMLR
jgi:hypothetical protein